MPEKRVIHRLQVTEFEIVGACTHEALSLRRTVCSIAQKAECQNDFKKVSVLLSAVASACYTYIAHTESTSLIM